jgi:hypothetical protein
MHCGATGVRRIAHLSDQTTAVRLATEARLNAGVEEPR